MFPELQKMKKISLLLSAILLFINVILSQNDPAAKKILDAVGAKVKASKGISANCTLNSITSKGKLNGTKTIILLMKGEKYNLKQNKSEIICDGQNVYSYDGDKTITKAPAEESAQSLNPQKLLSGSYDKDFSYKLISSAGTFYEIEMKPLDARKNFQKVNLFINKSNSTFAKARILDKSNNITELKINTINLSAPVAESSFIFNKSRYPKDAELLD